MSCGAGSVISGLGNGVLSIVGLNGVINPTDTTALNNAKTQYEDTVQQWQNVLEESKDKITADIERFLEAQIEAQQSQQNLTDTILQQNITVNSLAISLIGGLVIILIIFNLIS
jgi:hypothetical protein